MTSVWILYLFSFRQKVVADFCLRRQGRENITEKKIPAVCVLIGTYMAGNSMQQYFPRVRKERRADRPPYP